MCVSMYPARLTGTIGMVNFANHPEMGEIVVVGYQNNVQNLNSGPNAMLLHFPAAEKMNQHNFLNTERAPHILEDMAEAVKPRTRGVSRAKGLAFGSSVQIFEYGVYTVVLANDPRLFRQALLSVPDDRRPQINQSLFDWYAREKSGHSFALCCFNNREAKKATPFLVYYYPRNNRYLEFPGIDAHTGEAPDMSEKVEVDHTIVLSHYKMRGGSFVDYQDDIRYLANFLPQRVVGTSYHAKMDNGDFKYLLDEVESGSMPTVYRG